MAVQRRMAAEVIEEGDLGASRLEDQLTRVARLEF
jgi:hypothetical protein